MCYSCGHDEFEDCSMNSTGSKVYCQTDNPENRNYGDSCYVGHSGTCILHFMPYVIDSYLFRFHNLRKY